MEKVIGKLEEYCRKLGGYPEKGEDPVGVYFVCNLPEEKTFRIEASKLELSKPKEENLKDLNIVLTEKEKTLSESFRLGETGAESLQIKAVRTSGFEISADKGWKTGTRVADATVKAEKIKVELRKILKKLVLEFI